MSTANQKQQYLQAMREVMGELGRLNSRAAVMAQAFGDRGYDGAASDPVTESDLATFGVTPYDLGIAVNVLQQLNLLFSGQATSPSQAYSAVCNKWRQV